MNKTIMEIILPQLIIGMSKASFWFGIALTFRYLCPPK